MITIYLLNNPAYLNQPQKFQVGFIDTDGTLTDITSNCTIDILNPSGAIIVDTNTLVVNSTLQALTVELAITYLTEPIEYIEFALVQPFKNITQQNIYNTFLKYLPQNVFTTVKNPESAVYCNHVAMTTVLAQIYDNSDIENPAFTDLTTIRNRFFPDSGWSPWEQYLVGTNSLYLQQNTDYPALLQLFYQTNANNNTNPYWMAYNISRYIYYRLGEQYYVYIGEDVFNINGAFILNLNQLGNCLLSGSTNGSSPYNIIIYIIDGTPLSNAFRNELNLFIRRITRAGVVVTVDYDHTFTDFGLVDIQDTYWKDPRQNNTYCIAFNKNILAQALGYAGGANIQQMTSFEITLTPAAPSNNLTLGVTYEITVTATPPPIGLPKPLIQYVELFSSDTNVINFYMSSGVEYLHANSAGTCDITYYLGTLNQTITYTVL